MQILEEDVQILRFVEIVLYTKKGIWMLVRLNKLIKGNLQVVFEKMNRQESIVVAKRKVKEETGLSVTQLQ